MKRRTFLASVAPFTMGDSSLSASEERKAVCRQIGMSDKEIGHFLAEPPYLPFQWMG